MRIMLAVLIALLASQPASSQERDPRAALDELLGPPRYHECVGEIDLQELVFDAAPARRAPPIRRLVVAIDSSGSMAGDAGGRSKMQAAQEAAAGLLRGVPEGVSIGLVAFGHRGDNSEAGKAESCAGVETLYPIGTVEAAAVERAVEQTSATGWTPLAAAIEQAGGLFETSDTPGEQVVWVISDGEETCGGDPVAAARALRQGGAKAVVNIVGYDLPAEDRAALEAVADAGGGSFTEVEAGESLSDAADRALKQISEAGAETQAALNENKALAVRARNDAMSCFVDMRAAEQSTFTAFRSENNVTKARPRGEVLDMMGALRERLEAGKALIGAYRDDVDLQVEANAQELRAALAAYAKAVGIGPAGDAQR